RQLRGGPSYDEYTVTTLNRRERIGRIDQLGRAWRYEPRRNRGFEAIGAGVGTLEESAGAIFQTSQRITLEKTTERRLAFEKLDRDGSGRLEPAEMEGLGDRIPGADQNGDGIVDFDEFDKIDRL
ncbi:MAG: EF-hand domain-containing protein, partial [Planctomycetota bacterium]